MKIEHLKKFVGRPVIVQFRDAMALGTASGNGRLVPQCNEQGDILCKDGSIAADGTTPDELAVRPAWSIKVQRDTAERAEFRFAVEDAIIALDNDTSGEEAAVHVMYQDERSLLELTVASSQIVGITVVQTGPIEHTESRIVRPD